MLHMTSGLVYFKSVFLVFTLIFIQQLGGEDKNWECQKVVLNFCNIRGNISVYLAYIFVQQPRTNLICKHLQMAEVQSKI